jgi:hypothetical protein
LRRFSTLIANRPGNFTLTAQDASDFTSFSMFKQAQFPRSTAVEPPRRDFGCSAIHLRRNDGSLFLIPPLSLWGGWREAPGGVASYTRTAPTLHIVRSAHDLLSLPTKWEE